MAVKERGRERGAILRRMLEEREGGGGGVGNSKKEEGGRREEMDRNKTVGRGWKRKHDVKERRNRRKETIKISPLSAYIFCSAKYKLKNFCLQACAHQSTVTRGRVVD